MDPEDEKRTTQQTGFAFLNDDKMTNKATSNVDTLHDNRDTFSKQEKVFI